MKISMQMYKKKPQKKNKKKLTKKQIISRIMFIASAILILSVIPSSAAFFEDLYRYKQDYKGISIEKIQSDFVNRDYVSMIEKTTKNQALNVEITEEAEPYYAFAACYESAVDYHMYVTTGQTALAEQELKIFQENESKLNKKIFTDKIATVQNVYEIP